MADDREAVYAAAYVVANGLLRLNKVIDEVAIKQAVETIKDMPNFTDLDFDRLQENLEAMNNVLVGGYSILDDNEFQAWLTEKREQTDFQFWGRYERLLREDKRLPDAVVRRLDELTDDILDRLRDPASEGGWDRRGLVVGEVQSGKTANYTGLICKAYDAGFRLVIVLAGAHNSLRSQTQARLDEGVLGFDTRHHLSFEQTNQRLGVSLLPGAPLLVAHSLTSSSDNGDFKRTTVQGTQIVPGGKDPVLFVIKKHVSVLKNLLNWALSVRGEDDPESPLGKIIRSVPLLLIDDESDYASANTNEYLDQDGNVNEENDPTKTNKLIRQILSAFDQSCYVGYTATPFANIFMHHEGFAEKVGEDLFPRSFIINIPSPTNYLGAEKLFGLNKDGSEEDIQGLPIIEEIADAHDFFPLKHKKDLIVSGLPESLKTAIKCFIVACAARRVRGDVNEHNSMLIHVTRFTNVQGQVARLVKDEFDDLRRQLEYPGAGGSLVSDFQKLWNENYRPKSKMIGEMLPDEDLAEITWSDLEKEILPASKRIEIRAINGSAKDALDYVDHPSGLSVIAIGGDKLSRGLTLEGLSVSYFVRVSRMYDTLMQMGRWFGYRPKYVDLCRLFTTGSLVKWYRHISTASSELREEIDRMFQRGLTPLEYGHRVRTDPGGLLITSANKMRAGRKVRAGFSGAISETVAFDTDKMSLQENFNAFDGFIRELGKCDLGEADPYLWTEVGGEKVVELMKAVSTSRDSWKANSDAICRYIQDRLAAERLTNWTVLMASSGASGKRGTVGGLSVNFSRRKQTFDESKSSIGRLVSPPDEWKDLEKGQIKKALEATIEAWRKKKSDKKKPERPLGPWVREQRSKTNGLLMIYPINPEGPVQDWPLMGFAISFPFDVEAPLIDYAEASVRRLEEIFE